VIHRIRAAGSRLFSGYRKCIRRIKEGNRRIKKRIPIILGKGTPSLLISLCRYVVVIIPAAFLLSRFFGAVGVWNAFWITEAITAIISLVIYRKAITVKIDLFPVPLQSHPFKKIACSHQLDLRQWLHA